MTEAQLQASIRLALGADPGLVLWRNNVGEAEHWKGTRAMRVRYGLAPGSSDLIGILSPSGRFLALEVKAERGRLSDEQRMFLELVRSRGGFAAVVRSVDEAKAAVDRARTGAAE